MNFVFVVVLLKTSQIRSCKFECKHFSKSSLSTSPLFNGLTNPRNCLPRHLSNLRLNRVGPKNWTLGEPFKRSSAFPSIRVYIKKIKDIVKPFLFQYRSQKYFLLYSEIPEHILQSTYKIALILSQQIRTQSSQPEFCLIQSNAPQIPQSDSHQDVLYGFLFIHIWNLA